MWHPCGIQHKGKATAHEALQHSCPATGMFIDTMHASFRCRRHAGRSAEGRGVGGIPLPDERNTAVLLHFACVWQPQLGMPCARRSRCVAAEAVPQPGTFLRSGRPPTLQLVFWGIRSVATPSQQQQYAPRSLAAPADRPGRPRRCQERDQGHLPLGRHDRIQAALLQQLPGGV